MTPTQLLARTLAHRPAKDFAKWAMAGDHISTNATRNYMSYALGETHFQIGDYQTANDYYSRVSSGPHVLEARRMADWTAHKLGHYQIGWPRYPVAVFEPGQTSTATDRSGPVFVSNFNQPHELVENWN